MIRRAYRALLRLLPFEFRAEFGRDMEQAFSDERDDIRIRRRPAETAAFWLRTVLDFVKTAPRQHWDVLRQDVRGGTRILKRNPGFAATAILTLALGIGGSTGIFSVVYAIVLRPLGFPESERVVRIGWAAETADGTGTFSAASPADFRTLREQSTAFDLIGAVRYDVLASDRGSVAMPLPSSGVIGVGQSSVGPAMATASVFRIFGATTVLGRLPDEQDEQPDRAPVAVLSYSTWTSLYGRDPDVIGRTLTRNLGGGRSKTVTIVGVLAPGGMRYRNPSNETPVWASFDSDVTQERDSRGRQLFNLSLYGRLAPGTSVATAQTQIAAFSPHLATGLPDHIAAAKASLQAVRVRDQLVKTVRLPLLAFLGAVACLLLVASVNVASLVLARSLSRRHEFATRFAMGARPLRVARQLVTESAILAACGGIGGLGVAWLVSRAFVAISPSMPRLDESGIGTSAMVFALVATLVATCAAGLVPVLQTSRIGVVEGLRRAGGIQSTSGVLSRPLGFLATFEVAVVLVLLAGSGHLVNSFARLMTFDLGFDARRTIVAPIEHANTSVRPSGATSQPAGQDVVATLSERSRRMGEIDREVVGRVSGLAGVAAAGITGDVPFGPPYRYAVDIRIGERQAPASAALRIASPSALDALGMRMAAGRWFTPGDRDGSPYVAVVNQTMAAQSWSGNSPVGDRILFGRRVLQVVGVVADVYEQGARGVVRPTLFVSSDQIPADPAVLVVRASPGASGLESSVAAELATVGGIKPGGPRKLEDFWWRQLSDARFHTLVLTVFSLLTLAVSLVGIHGVLRFLVIQRTKEMGIRKALGATRRDVVALVVGQALRFAIPGCLLGLAAAAATGPALRTLVFGISPADPTTLLVATALLVAAVVAGAYSPARRANAVDPAQSLRCE